MTDYIDITNLPSVVRRTEWQILFEEWRRIPPGKALELEVTEEEDRHTVTVGVGAVLRRNRPHHLRLQQVNKRLYIINDREQP